MTAGWPPAPRRSAIDAFSSIRSGVKGLGCLNASSSAQRIALWVCWEMCTAGCAAFRWVRFEDELLGGIKDGGRVVEASSRGSLSRSWESCLTGRCRSFLAAGSGVRFGSAVAKSPPGLIPTETASKWTRLGGEAGWFGGGLGVPTNRGVRRKPRCDSGVDAPDLELCSGEIGVCDRRRGRCWRCWAGSGDS